MSSQELTARSQAGFTLVELAIVMIIIGLLIGGVLKGQELIGNAQVTATIAQLKGIEAATTTFKDTYASLPGDLINSSTRLPNCTVAPCNTGTAITLGNGQVDSAFTGIPSVEGEAYFVQLAQANLLTGIIPGTNTFGGNFPAAKIGGNGILAGSVGTVSTATLPGAAGTFGVPGGLFLAVTNSPTTAVSATSANLKPTEAYRIDTKMDDGAPNTGIVIGFGTGATCASDGTDTATYVTSGNSNTCGVFYHAQN